MSVREPGIAETPYLKWERASFTAQPLRYSITFRSLEAPPDVS